MSSQFKWFLKSIQILIVCGFSSQAFAGVIKSNAVTIKVVAAPDPNGQISSFQLTSIQTGLLPFTIGMGFKKGDAPGGIVLDIPDSQIVVMKKWNDGSAKHAIISGHANLLANQIKTIHVFRGVSQVATNLTAAQIAVASPGATVTLGSLGSVTLSSLLSAPIRTFVSGPEMVEAHYMQKISSALVFFHVRLYKNGRVWIRTSVENGFIDAVGTDLNYAASVNIGGALVYSASLTHYGHTRWTVEGWVGGDPQVTQKLNTIYLVSSKLVPNYMMRTPSSAALSKLYQSYKPNENGGWTPNMGDTGYQEQIGLLPIWDSLYVTSGADSRAFNSVTANAKALSSYAIVWRGSSDNNLPMRPSVYPTYSFNGASQGGGSPPAVGPKALAWEMAHHGSAGYLAYLITGEYFYLETMEHQAGNCFLNNDINGGTGVNRIMSSQVRAVAWCMRTMGQLVGLAPQDSVTPDYAALLQNNAAFHLNAVQTPGMNQLGFIYEYCPGDLCYNGYSPAGSTSVFMHDFFVQSFGMVSDLEPLSNMSTWNSVRDWIYKIPVGILGSGAPGTFCFNYASAYTIMAAPGAVSSLTQAYNNWGQVFTATNGSAACGNTLLGNSGSDPSAAAAGYWGNLMPAIAYAVDHGAPGAAAAWARLSGASNWSNVVLKSGFEDTPLWGVVPR